MDIQQDCFKFGTTNQLLNFGVLFFLFLIPLSCAAQKNSLSRISAVERSDNQGHVIRFHLAEAATSFDFSQPANHLVQFQIKGPGLSTRAIKIDDRSDVIKDVQFYELPGGIGMDILLEQDSFFEANAYPDRNKKDLLLALTRTTEQKLAQAQLNKQMFTWSDAKLPDVTSPKKPVEVEKTQIDTSYQKIKDNIKFDTIVLDAGHGGHDVGAIGYNRTYEKKIALAIAKKVGGYINKYLPDVKVVYTRNGDYLVGAKKNPDISIMQSLIERGQIANRAGGDLFVSIHCNSARARQAHGTETYFLGLERSQTALEVMKRENNIVGPDAEAGKELSQEDLIIYELANSGYIANSERLAGMIQSQFKNRANRKSRGVKQARFVVLYHASMPAVLIETGFISNPSEAKYLTSEYGQSIIASAIFRAIRNYKAQFDKSQHFNTN